MTGASVLTAIFPGETMSAGSFQVFPPPPVLEYNLWGLLEWVFYGLNVLPSNIHGQCNEGVQSTNPD